MAVVYGIWNKCSCRGFLKGNVVSVVEKRGMKICVLGAMGGLGQPLSLLLKQSPYFSELALFDLKSSRGLALELNQIDTECRVTGHDDVKNALKGAKIVITAAGATWTKGMTTEGFLNTNAKTISLLAAECARHCPKAFNIIETNPVNMMLPLAVETYRQVLGCVEPGRVIGLTIADVMRASSLLAELTRSSAPEQVWVPVVGGHSSTTAVPLFSRARPCVNVSTDEIVRLTRAVQSGPADVRAAKEDTGPPVVVGAVAAFRFAEDLARALVGERGIVTCAYVMSNLIEGLSYFASPVELGPAGVQKILPIPKPLTNFECCLIESAVGILKKDVEKGLSFAFSSSKSQAVQ